MFPSGRFALVGAGDLRHPGQCAVCGNSTNIDGYLNLDIYYEYEGNVYLCMNCVREAIHVVGALLPDEAEHLKAIVESANSELKAIKEQLHDYKHVDDLINRIRLNTPNAVADVISDVVEESAAKPINTPNAAESAGSGESKPQGPVKGRRPNDVTRPKVSNKPTINL